MVIRNPGVIGFWVRFELEFHRTNMQDDDTEQPLTDHLVDQFASYFLLTMLTFHLFGYVKKQYEKRMAEEKFPLF